MRSVLSVLTRLFPKLIKPTRRVNAPREVPSALWLIDHVQGLLHASIMRAASNALLPLLLESAKASYGFFWSYPGMFIQGFGTDV